ncbi:MAG: hypothetical protein RQ826_09525 [Xanthomonadales bacterium]|nr:hypothetical protein [Xanthomonadales bacterium]
MDGRKQVELYAQLAQPEQLAGIRIGDAVRLPNIDTVFEVVRLEDPLLILRAPSGRELRAGWRAVKLQSGAAV